MEIMDGPTMGEDLHALAALACATPVDPPMEVQDGMGSGKRVVLVCEGDCNPHLYAIDERLAALHRRTSTADHDFRHRPEAAEDMTTLAAVRRLVYTKHVQTTGDLFACLRCGRVRKFGESLE